MVNGVPREVPRPETLGACGPSGFSLGTSLGTPFTMIARRLFQIMYQGAKLFLPTDLFNFLFVQSNEFTLKWPNMGKGKSQKK